MQPFVTIAPRVLVVGELCSRLAGAIFDAWQAYRLRRREAATIRLLEGLDDRTLRDIGVDRREIAAVVGARGIGRRLAQDIDAASLRG